ncbi:DegT/DnrJ/EryC1/StrS family aminotransferase [Vibrio toranzoniae]|uniref:DegT/DnrJ/EryC1/StrS aminotransferase family protein n=1 Tax=Vibrio toranzoniae TaxID=1194427 RepID=UPI001378DBB4|nr:DegT/DnrJ/EryC1/StrS family aminotransferase [Vibrio toranzoniae]NAZ95986.1 DegT/DnrJ/EryC1/StrS family aminotransferase [Vibrio toranzoniae]
MIALNSPVKPDLKKLQKLLERVNKSGWFTNFGPMHRELTEKLEDYLGVQNLLLTNNGTSALQVAGRAIGSHSIISTPFSFVATVSAFKWQKDQVSFADIDLKSLNLCPQAVKVAYRKGCKADTLVATHVYGNPCDVTELDKLSSENNFQIIYDAAHAFGVKINGQSVLNYGDASTLSFHATKVFHTVEGGAIVFKERSDYEKAEEIINFGIRAGQGVVNVGMNAKMNEYQAAVGIVNLENIDNVLNHRAELFDAYRSGLKDIVTLPTWHPESNANGAYMPILLENKTQLDKIIKVLDANHVQSRHYFTPSLDKIFVDSHNYGTPNSLQASKRILCLPLHAHLAIEDIHKILNVLKGVKL